MKKSVKHLLFFFFVISISPQYLVRFLIFRTHFRRDVGKESHLLASRDTGDIGRGTPKSRWREDSSSSSSSGGRGSHSEGHWKAKRVRGGQPGGSLGRFLDRSPKSGFIPPASLSGTSNPFSPFLSLFLCLIPSQFRRTCLRYIEQSKRATRSTTFFSLRSAIFLYVSNSVEGERRKII